MTPTVSGMFTYTVQCKGSGGTGQQTVTLDVSAPTVPSVTIGVSPGSSTLGAPAVLTWSATSATSCTASGDWTGVQNTSGSANVTPLQPGSYTYGLSCSGPAGSGSGSATLTEAFDWSVTTQAAVPLPVPQLPSPALRGRLSEVRSFEYVVDNTPGTSGINQAIGTSSADLVFLNMCATDPPINRAVADPTGTKLIFGYLDVAEAFACAEPQLFTGTLPTWFGNPNPGFPGLYTVQYWNPAWETAVFANIDHNMTSGVDGIFLDVLSADYEWSSGNLENNVTYANATSAMETLLADIRNYVDTNYPGKTVYLVGNSPQTLALNYPNALKNLDGIFNEFVFYGQSLTNGKVSQFHGTTFGQFFASTLAPLYASANVPLFGNEYPTPLSSGALDLQTVNYYTSLGWIPSATTPVQSDAIFSTGPFMFTATPNNSSVTGSLNYMNYLSGGIASNATLTGGNQGDVFVGGPGTNMIIGGTGNDTIYAHPVYAGYEGRLVIALANQNNGTAAGTPSVAISVNGISVIPTTPITSPYNTSMQVFVANVSTLAPVTSVVLTVSGNVSTDSSDYSQVVIQQILYNGVAVDLASGSYSHGGDANGFTYTLNGTVSFNASAWASTSPYLSATSDTINGGGGTNTVVYRAPANNYTLVKQSNGSWVVTSFTTAEGPDTLTNIQSVMFSDKTVSLTN